ncbi:hypothetical protein KC343_g7957 [Hortaea werneckii]|uniref:Uncharacterized protein n=1 Tax=Hortaea werneckii TaxID=91943 RepID=A0A3M7HPA7_HORWE|nr:hypothetical protein KC323_g1320 [Hortaea werneckii]KAI7357712.1 hypothetical protein KC320_g1622 [Hortaea werneckii]KAI7572058.1 hypothetical protein KC317_g1105 [Hortaea werneckii]KAI7621601.1 hypothetical protein KC343_g7957 [Hortaea werneckii]KAI7626817.1 hypothetical protein KC346_g1058 [Hortaea werneckii]
MAAAFLPPLDFSLSERHLATAISQPQSPILHPRAPEDDGNSVYATTVASSVTSTVNGTTSVAVSIQPDEAVECVPPNTQERKPSDNSKNPQPFSRLFSRHGTVNSSQSKKLVKRATKGEGGDADPECNTRVKRTWSIVSKKNDKQNEFRSYRCDIYAASSDDFRAALAECRQLVREADGRLLDDFAYPGGFLFQLPSNSTSPLANVDETAGGGRISITEWTKPFPQPLFNGLKLTPYGGAGELLIIPVPPHRSSAKQMEKAKAEQNDVAKKRVSSWVSSLATNYGNSMSHMS